MEVWAEAGVAEKIKMKARRLAVILLGIVKLDKVPDLEFGQPVGVDLKDIPGWLARSIGWSPGSCQDGVYNNILGIDPDDRQVYENKQHMDGRFKTGVACFNKQQAFIGGEAGTEHQATQTAEETVAVKGV